MYFLTANVRSGGEACGLAVAGDDGWTAGHVSSGEDAAGTAPELGRGRPEGADGAVGAGRSDAGGLHGSEEISGRSTLGVPAHVLLSDPTRRGSGS